MTALLHLDAINRLGRPFLLGSRPEDAALGHRLEDAAEALRHLGIMPAASPLSIEQLHERLAATLARASNLPHSAWRGRLAIRPRSIAAEGKMAWDIVTPEPAALPFIRRAAELVLPFAPFIDAGSRG
ncbi:hypothetical protein [Rhizorhabdus dicambivorans]|nr:hypothetical protein [Rhizorhabdus dicambivorans]